MAEPEVENVTPVAIESDSDFMHVDSTPTTSDRDEDGQSATSNNRKNELFRSSLFEELDEKKLALRASRFGTEAISKVTLTESETLSLYKSLGLDNQDETSHKNGRIRFNAIHLRGVENMNTQSVLDYFKDYSPDLVEWINDHSCNVVWTDSSLAARAILDLSRPIRRSPSNKNNAAKDEEIASEPEEGEDVEMTEQESEEQRMRHISADSDTQQEPFRRSASHQSGTPVPNNSPVDTSQIDDVTTGLGAEIDSSKIEIPIPPGHWRLGVPTEKAKALLLRFAFRTDRKIQGAEKLSHYYVKHGNPNYKGLKGIISTSYKNKVQEGRKRPHYVDLDAPVEDNQHYSVVKVEEETVIQEQTKRPRMRMYADEEEEKQKNRSSSVTSSSLHPADLRNRIIHEKSNQAAASDDLRARLHSRQPWNTPQAEESFDQELADVQSLLKQPRNLSMPIVMGDLRNKLEKLRQARQPKVPLLIEVSQDDA